MKADAGARCPCGTSGAFWGLDVLGLIAGAVARLLQDSEIELWEGKRTVTSLEDDGQVHSDIFLDSRLLD